MRVNLVLRASGEEALWKRGQDDQTLLWRSRVQGSTPGLLGGPSWSFPSAWERGVFLPLEAKCVSAGLAFDLGVSPALLVQFAYHTPLLVLCRCGPESLEIKRYLTFNISLCETI